MVLFQEGIAGTSAILSLLDAAFSVVQAIRKARNAVKGATKALDKLADDLRGLEQTFKLVQAEPLLQTPAVEDALKVLIARENELRLFFENIKRIQDRHTITKTLRAIKDGDKDDKELQSIMDGLSSDRQTLSLRIQVIHVGLTGNQVSGFRIAYDTLKRVDTNVQALGSGLENAYVLEGRSLRREGDAAQMPDVDTSAADKPVVPSTARFQTRNLQAGDNLRMNEGDLGFDARAPGAGQHSTMDGVKFGNHAQVNLGDVSKDIAKDFINAFWGSRP
ncbi:hypothetical protein TWF696_004793 [Orbilia brochopaga]|uniref:NACHT-NTPase and P-loop NTPases N-terminal domain-containing protein n=1 Tax=Orbilia brochopaga TaxID=3140254 RepID=A0AAV9V1V4_9PEZI